jgi:rubrerythrin
MQEDKLKNIKKVIDAEEYSTGNILDRAKEAAISDKDEKVIKNIIVASRCKKRSRKTGRK